MGAISSLGEDNCDNNHSSNSTNASGVLGGVWKGLTQRGQSRSSLERAKGRWHASAMMSAGLPVSKAGVPEERKLSKAGVSVRKLPFNQTRARSGVYLNPPQEHGLSASESGFYINPG